MIDLSGLPAGLRLGTSSYSSPDWRGHFYPEGMRPEQFLPYYAQHLNTVEVDATWHAIPSRKTVEAWRDRVPPGFVFSIKAPKSITHDHYLVECEEEWGRFLSLIDLLGEKRGPILFQFPYVPRGQNPEEYRTGNEFRRRLERFLPLLPAEGRYVVEVRNREWVKAPLLDLLKSRRIALALTAYYTMPSAAELLAATDPCTAEFAYVRFLGNHRDMDNLVARERESGRRNRDWGELLVDRRDEMGSWIPAVRTILLRVPEVLVYFNNHYAGYAPGSLALFTDLWREQDGRPA